MKALAMIMLVGLSLIAGMGCDLFQTRTPQPPSQGTSTNKVPIDAETVIENLQFSIAEYNIDNYMNCFASPSVRPFEFIPSQEVQASYTGLFSQWGLESERRYFQNLAPFTTAAPFISFSSKTIVTLTSDSAVYNLNYTLFIPHRRTDVPRLVQGNMQVYFGTDAQQRWSIYRWQDSKTTADSTWSYLKAVFSGS